MARDISKTEEQTNGLKEVVNTRIITENELINFKLDSIIRLLKEVIPAPEEEVEQSE